jgi:hypothetical protein
MYASVSVLMPFTAAAISAFNSGLLVFLLHSVKIQKSIMILTLAAKI